LTSPVGDLCFKKRRCAPIAVRWGFFRGAIMGYFLRLLLPVAAFLALVFGVSRPAAPGEPAPQIVRAWQRAAAETSDSSMPEIIRGPVLPPAGPAAVA